ncbi:MAG: DUF6064 family protein [Candidatus Binatia bacterium]
MMNLPFNADQFFRVLAQYNQAVWPMPLVLNGAALACAGLLFCAQPWASRVIALLLAGLWLWMALAYHFSFFALINPAAWWFGILFLLGGAAFDWFGVVEDRLRFQVSSNAWKLTGAILIIFAIAIYPLIGYAIGRRYPAALTFGLPSPTTIFTIGLLLFAEAPLPRSVFLVPIIWCAIGSLAALWLGVLEDLSLTIAGLVGLAAVFYLHGRPGQIIWHSNAPHSVRP